MLQEEIKKPVVTIFADDNKKYLSTELSNPVNKNPEFTSNKVELIEYKII